jgi:hypothetical protein
MNVTRMDSHGGWLATPSDLVIFLDHIVGSKNIPSLLKPESIKIMTTPSPAYSQSSPGKYARGWMVRNNGAGNCGTAAAFRARRPSWCALRQVSVGPRSRTRAQSPPMRLAARWIKWSGTWFIKCRHGLFDGLPLAITPQLGTRT